MLNQTVKSTGAVERYLRKSLIVKKIIKII